MSVRIVTMLAVAAGLVCHTSAWAQSADVGAWEIDVHAGGMWPGQGTGAQTALPAAGAPFTVVNGRSSQVVTSWYFGAGATFLNQHAAAFTAIQRSGRIAALDPVLTGTASRSSNAASLGLRVGRRLTSRLTAEMNVDYGPSRVELQDAALTAIEASRATFTSVFSELLASANPLQFQNKVVTSSSTFTDSGGGQLVAIGAARVRLRRSGALMPHVTAGLGGAFSRGEDPAVTLRGNYSFVWTAGQPFNETDTVTVRWVRPARTIVGLLGGGFTYDVARRHGFRADLRWHVRPNRLVTEVSASPAVTAGTPSLAFASATDPSVQYSNTALAETRSTLSGSPITGFRTRQGTGTQVDVLFSAGYFWRF